MYPTLFNLGPIPVRAYGFMMMLGFLISIHLAARRARRCGADEELVLNIGLIALITGVLGARLFYVIHYPEHFSSVIQYFAIWTGGLEFYGGFLLAVAAILIYMYRRKQSIRLYMDILAPAIMLGLAFGRIGCFLNGCCWGKPTSLVCAVKFPYASPAFQHQWYRTRQLAVPGEFIMNQAQGRPILIDRETLNAPDQKLADLLKKVRPHTANARELEMVDQHLKKWNTTLAGLKKLADKIDLRSLAVHPTQLYSSFNALAISLILSWYFWRRRKHGMVIALLFVIYPINRFLLELMRADNPYDTFGLTVSQGVSLAVVPIALLFMLYLRRLDDVSPRVAVAAKGEERRAKSEKRKAKSD